MKEIRFRAWDKKRERWVEKDDYITLALVHTEGNIWYFCADGIIDVMQYTGLKDKNGKEIYEGDILHITGIIDTIAPVAFDRAHFGVRLPDDPEIVAYFPLDEGFGEVIGNIYENPELLEQK